jgi:hypothetical protein
MLSVLEVVMSIFIVTLIMMLFVALALSISVLAGRKPIAGSCGGVGKALGEPDYVCALCGGDEAKCEAEKEKSSNRLEANEPQDLAYDASKQKKE